MKLREALNRSVRETHISQEGLSEKMISSADGSMYSKKDMAMVCRILIDFNQDPDAALALHRALELLWQERKKYDIEGGRSEEEERKKKREEYDKAIKGKGKGKVGEGSTTKEISPIPQLPSPKPTPPRYPSLGSIRPSGLSYSTKIQTRILPWNDIIKDELGAS